jgi:Mg-chelatase subunit ChlI
VSRVKTTTKSSPSLSSTQPLTCAQVDLLPLIDVVKDDAFMSSPTDPNLMAPEVLAKFRAGEALETARIPINMVDLPLGATVGLYKLNPVNP